MTESARRRRAHVAGVARQLPPSLAHLLRLEWQLRRRPVAELAGALGVPLQLSNTVSDEVIVLPRWAVQRIVATDLALQLWPIARERRCLRRSLIIGHRLRGLEPRLRLGVARADGSIVAHAWITVRNVPIAEDNPAYAAFATPRASDGPRR